MSTTEVPYDQATEIDWSQYAERDRVVVCLGGLSEHVNGSPIFGCLVYGPFFEDEVEEKAKEIRQLEGGAVLIRPLVDLVDTYRRLSAD